ncbi:MAG: helix-turn-helix transcriptional regulator [Marinisporobacter sp.]|jgi:DNA-binding HxlR family transcriptional regulator|nr:helix-turn-helix transcriptional regulator [Marinisporobacter sp.]
MSTSCTTFEFKNKHYTCTFEITIDLIGGKWKPLIIWHLGTKGTHRFNELRRLIPQITQKMLTQQLRELESDNLVIRKVYPQVPPKVEYSLSPLGETLMPILSTMCDWGNDYYKLNP